MADTAGQKDIRSIHIDTLAKGFADLEPNIIKNFVAKTKTSAREIRWYQKTSGFLDTAGTDDTSISLMTNTAVGARPFVAEQSWTRNTSFAKEFMVESQMLSNADLKDNDVQLLPTTIRDLVRGLQRKVGLRMFQILFNASPATPTLPLTGSVTVQTTVATADGWNDAVTGDPITDILNGQQKIRAQGYDSGQAIIAMNSLEHKFLMQYLINVKGSSIPSFSSEKLKSGAVMEIL